MGSKNSKSSNKEVKIDPQYWGTETYKNSIKYDKYACEIYSTSQQTKENSDILTISKQPEKEQKTINKEKVPFKFEWKGLGSSVILAGSFLQDWKKFIPMIKNTETEIFEKVVYLTKEKHYFKYIVDNKWACSSQYPTTFDNSHNQNNFIDLSNYSPPKDLIKREEYKKGEIKSHRSKVIVLDNNNKKKYNCKFPLTQDLNDKAPNVLIHYKPSFDIDYQSNQNKLKKIGTEICLNYKEKNSLTENNTFKKILICPHERLMHLCQSIGDLKNKNKRYIKGSTTIRNKHKYLTVIYYRPK